MTSSLEGRELTEGRVKEAIRLYKQGVPKHLVFVGGKDEVGLVSEMVRDEVDSAFFDGNSSSTVDNAYYAK